VEVEQDLLDDPPAVLPSEADDDSGGDVDRLLTNVLAAQVVPPGKGRLIDPQKAGGSAEGGPCPNVGTGQGGCHGPSLIHGRTGCNGSAGRRGTNGGHKWYGRPGTGALEV